MPTARKWMLHFHDISCNSREMDAARLVAFRIWILAVALWAGAGVYFAINTHWAWYSDPVAWVANTHPAPGSINPWPAMTAVVVLATLVLLGFFASGRVPGRRGALILGGGTVVILVATVAYFVPQLVLIFQRATSLTEAQSIAASRAWVCWNLVRIFTLLGLLYYALTLLPRIRPTAPLR